MDNSLDWIGRFIVIFFVVTVLIGWLILCRAKFKKWHDRKIKCIKRINVVVSDVLERKTARGAMLYKPIFQVEAEEYIIDSAFYSNLVKFQVGEKLELLVNPENYKQFLYADDRYNKGLIADVICCFIPLIFLIIIFMI